MTRFNPIKFAGNVCSRFNSIQFLIMIRDPKFNSIDSPTLYRFNLLIIYMLVYSWQFRQVHERWWRGWAHSLSSDTFTLLCSSTHGGGMCLSEHWYVLLCWKRIPTVIYQTTTWDPFELQASFSCREYGLQVFCSLRNIVRYGWGLVFGYHIKSKV